VGGEERDAVTWVSPPNRVAEGFAGHGIPEPDFVFLVFRQDGFAVRAEGRTYNSASGMVNRPAAYRLAGGYVPQTNHPVVAGGTPTPGQQGLAVGAEGQDLDFKARPHRPAEGLARGHLEQQYEVLPWLRIRVISSQRDEPAVRTERKCPAPVRV